jgi:hypothetical protein
MSNFCFQVPKWHGQELMLILHEQLLKEKEVNKQAMASPGSQSIQSSVTSSSFVESAMLRWRHVQALVRLTQVVHVLADTISDWDTIVDSFEQLVSILIANTGKTSGGLCVTSIHDELTSLDVDKIIQSIERFIQFSVFLSDETLVRLMTSLVALSLNSLAISGTFASVSTSGSVQSQPQHPSGGSSANRAVGSPAVLQQGNISTGSMASQMRTGNDQRVPVDVGGALRRLQYISCESYMMDALGSSSVSYSLHAVVEITKLNAFRVSTIWQMVASHLRVMASHKVCDSYLQLLCLLNICVCIARDNKEDRRSCYPRYHCHYTAVHEVFKCR